MSDCKGLFYRGLINTYINAHGTYVRTESMRLLKRKSCSGCERCSSMEDDFKEFIGNGIPPIMPEIQHGATYELIVSNISTDWESGIVDDWDLEFREVK